MSFIRSQRDTWTTRGRSALGGALADHLRGPDHTAVGLDAGRLDQIGAREQRNRLCRPEVQVLRRKRIDRWRDHSDARAFDPVRRERLAREHVRVGGRDVGAEELPGTVGPLVLPVEADVAAPDDDRARLDEGGDERSRLRVVDDDDVAATDDGDDGIRVPPHRRLVGRALAGAELAPVSRRPVQAVVDPLRDVEELRVGVDHAPVALDAHAEGVPDERVEKLGDAAARRGRVHVHEPSPVEALGERVGGRHEEGDALASDQRLEAAGIDRHDLDAPHRRHRNVVWHGT